jgi:hypothetical protein
MAPALAAPDDDTYDPNRPHTIGTDHNATGVISDNDVAIRILNVTGSSSTEVALNDSDAVPVEGNVNTTIPAGDLSGNVTVEIQLFNTSSDYAAANATLNLTALSSTNESTFVDVDASDLPGDGSQSAPYEISNASELQAMEDDLSANYTLVSDIDASNTARWNNGRGFDPVGTAEFGTTNQEFKGSLNGNGQSINGLTINRSGNGYIGLFGSLDSATITNISITDVTVTGDFETAGLAGETRYNSTIRNITASGTVSGTYDVGGVVGAAEDNTTIQSATAAVEVIDNDGGDASAGGLIGGIEGNSTIQNVTASGSVIGGGPVGGLAGRNSGTIQNATASGNVRYISSGVVSNQQGGLVGRNRGTIQNATAYGSVDGNQNVGGLVGFNDDYGDSTALIENAEAVGTVTGDTNVGGLVGNNNNRGEIANTTASGSVDGEETIGGLVAINNGTVKDATASGRVTGVFSVGGLVGDNDRGGTIQNTSSSGNVNAVGDFSANIGGHVGVNEGKIKSVTTSGNVSGPEEVGGLVGENDQGMIQYAKATGSVNGNTTVGGLVGRNNNGTIRETFAVGSVSGNIDTGGLIANNTGFDGSGTINASYWDIEETGLDSSAGAATGLTTDEITGVAAQANMANLSFGEVWQTQADGYPILVALTNGSNGSFSQLAAEIDTDNDNRIGDFEVLQAIEYWRTNQEVPNTNQTITDQEILTLIDMWETETEVAA